MGRDIEEIRRDIEATRARLRDTSEAIGWKADLPSRARDALRETAGVVRERMSDPSRRPPPSTDDGESGPGIRGRLGAAKEAIGSAKEAVAERAGSAKGAVAERAGSAKEAVAERTGAAKGAMATVAERAGSAKEAVAERGGSAAETLASAREGAAQRMPSADGARRVAGAVRSNPVPLALGALAAGIAAGLYLPRTSAEDERLGPIGDQVRDRGAELGKTAVERGKEVAQEAAETAKEAVR
jgi:Protein of unknown function (DUF3618)